MTNNNAIILQDKTKAVALANESNKQLQIAKTNSTALAVENSLRGATQYNNIIDEIIVIDISLDSLVIGSDIHRKFCFFGDLAGLGNAENKLKVDKANFNNVMQSLTNTSVKSYLKTWFNAGGNEITIYQVDFKNLTDLVVDEVNILLFGNTTADQQVLYDFFKFDLSKNIFYTKKQNETFNITPNRQLAGYLIPNTTENVDGDTFAFYYYAKYNQTGGFRFNDFEKSPLGGVDLTTTAVLVNNKIGGSIFLPEASEYLYYNMVDAVGLPINYLFLKGDLKQQIQVGVLKILMKNSLYNQVKINVINNTINNIMSKKVGAEIIKYTLILPSFKEVSQADKNAGKYGTINVGYTPTPSMRQVYINLEEDFI